MQLLRYIVRPLSAWGTPLRSDTLSGLLLWRIAERYGSEACRKAIDAFRDGNPPFILSSALPKDMVFTPRLPPVPRTLFRQWADAGIFQTADGSPLSLFDTLQAYKKFRKTPYLPVEVWLNYAPALSLRPLLIRFCQMTEGEKTRTSSESVEPHVSIDRQSGTAIKGGLFFNRLTWFSKETAFHLYARAADPSTLLEMLREVGELGFGKDTSTGKGRFAVDADTTFDPAQFENDGPHSMLCSVCAAMDMSALDGWYAVEAKRGKVGPASINPHKAPMLLVQEGSVLRTLPTGPYVLEGINSDTSIIQVTQPLALPCRLVEEKPNA